MNDVSEARERVVERLTQHFANDELTEAALEEHLQQVYAATTLQHLEAIVAQLPALPQPTIPARRSPDAGTAVSALFSGQERRLVTVVPRELAVRARFGYVELDLREATFEPGVTTIDVRSFMGYVQIRFPRHVRVESSGRAVFGFFALRGVERAAPAPTESVVRVTGHAIFGYAEGFVTPSPAE